MGSRLGISKQDVLLVEARDSIFHDCPFRRLPSMEGTDRTNSGLVLVADSTNHLVGDSELHMQCCAWHVRNGLDTVSHVDCHKLQQFPRLHYGLIRGRHENVITMLRSWLTHTGKLDTPCTDEALLSVLAWSGTLLPGMAVEVLPTETGPICTVKDESIVRVDPRGKVVNRLGRPCAIVRGFEAHRELRDVLSLEILPGTSAPHFRLPAVIRFPSTHHDVAHTTEALPQGELESLAATCCSCYRLLKWSNDSRCTALGSTSYARGHDLLSVCGRATCKAAPLGSATRVRWFLP